jgi:hypothetical protein
MIVPEDMPKVKQPGYIYLIRLVGMTRECYKIGKTRQLGERLNQLQIFNNKKSILIAYGVSDDITRDERFMLDTFDRVCDHGEYFNFKVSTIPNVISRLRWCCKEVHTDFSYNGEPENYQRLLPYHLDDLTDDESYAFLTREQELLWGFR